MTELEIFENVWNRHFLTTQSKNTIKNRPIIDRDYTIRSLKTKEKYENILFSIWKHHPDYSEKNGFQIKCKDRTIYRVLDLAEQSGLLKKIANYSVGNFTRIYRKNCILFDMVYRNQNNQYGVWLSKNCNQNQIELDMIHNELINNLNKSVNIDNLFINTNEIQSKKIKRLSYDLSKLHILSRKMLPYYYNLLSKMNKKVDHPDLCFLSYIKFNNYHLPTGRPYSYFCSTLNRNKKHKNIDTSMEYRDDFLKRIGLPDYYEIYDIKSEIPRINLLFHTGVWKDDNYDFYSEIVKDTNMSDFLDWNIKRGATKDTEYEDSMKSIFMRIYFGKGSDLQSYNGFVENKLLRLGDDYMDFWLAQSEEFEINFDIWKELCKSTEKICGKSIGNLIFWYAFFIETEVKIELLKRGKKVYNVYDGFYFNKDISDEIRILLNDKAIYVYNKYMKVIK